MVVYWFCFSVRFIRVNLNSTSCISTPDVQRKGVGGELIDHVAARAKKKAIPALFLP